MIVTHEITKKFDGFPALSGVSCVIPNGCIFGMVGSNGAGKSTFLRVLSGVYRADEGTAQIDGCNIYENPAVKARIAYVPDELYFPGNPTMNRMAQLYAAAHQSFSRERFDTFCHDFSLDPKKPIGTFSKGMKRQAATILALSTSPDYIFFDETFDGLDPVVRNFVKSIICSDVLDRHATAIITSHSLRELEDTCDQLALLHRGGIVVQSEIENLKTKQFKVQIAFSDAYDDSRFAGIDVVHSTRHGSVSNLIVRGDRADVEAKLRALNPGVLDILPLSLEEIFTYEMEALGYTFQVQ